MISATMDPRVETYSGYRADERPVRFVWQGRTFEVVEVLERWREPDYACFRVKTNDGKRYLLRQRLGGESEDEAQWLIEPGGS
jgi:hypothetical protein